MVTVAVVAAPEMRVVRRRKGAALVASGAPRALTAASAPVDDPAQIFKAGVVGRRGAEWQTEAWEMLDRVGELGWYVRWRANSCSRVRLVASEIDPLTGEPTGSVADDDPAGQRFAQIVRSIAGGQLGQAQLIKRSVQCLTVPGEFWVAILVRPEGEKWYAVTREEIERDPQNSKAVLIVLPDGTKHRFDTGAGDGMFRVWNPHAKRASEPDSPVRANLDSLREIVRTTKKITNADNSRLLNNGILAIPQEASLPSAQAPTAADKPAGAPELSQGGHAARALQDMIVSVATVAAEEGENSLASLIPIVASVPAEHVDKIKHVKLSDDVTDVAIKTRNDGIARLAMGLDMAPEQLLGLGRNSNHWTAFMLADEDVQLHVSPVMETICSAIYDNVLRGMLDAEGIDPDRYTLWYDTSRLTADPDLTDEARDAFEKGAISSEALLRIYGLPDDAAYDFTTPEGRRKWAQDRVSQDPRWIRELLPLLDPSMQEIEFPEPPPALPARSEPPRDDRSGSERGQEPDTEDNEPSGRDSASAADGVSMAVELMVTRALELAGKRRRRRSDMERLRDVPEYEYHRYMDPVADSDVPGLIKGWDLGLDEIAARYGLDADQLRVVVQREARRQLTSQVVDV